MEGQTRAECKQRTVFYIKLYTLVLLTTVGVLGFLFQREIQAKFRKDTLEYIDISFSVYGGLVGSMLNLLVYLPMAFRHLRHWTEEDREAHFCWLFLRPLLGGLAGFVSYGMVNALPIQLDMGEGQRIFWFMFCASVFAGFKSEDFILKFSQRFESLVPTAPKAQKSEPTPPEQVVPLRRRVRGHRHIE